MTIEYKDSKRIVGLSTDIVQTLTFEDDFDYATQALADASWVSLDTAVNRVNITNDNLDVVLKTNNSDDTMAHDLGSSLSDSAWVCRFKWNITGLTRNNTSAWHGWIGLSSTNQTGEFDDSQDSMGLGILTQNTGGNTMFWYASGSSAGAVNEQSSQFDDDVPTGTYYIEMIRNADVITVNVYTDSNYSNLFDGGSDTITGTVTGLQYFKVANKTANYSGTITSTIDDLKIWNDVTSISSRPTDVQDNSLLVEKDTARRYWFDSGNLTFEDDFSGTDNWTDWGSGSPISVSTTNDRLDFDVVGNDQANDIGSQYDLTSVSDTAFVLDFDYTTTNIDLRSSGSAVWIYLGLSSLDNNGTNKDQTAQDYVGIYSQISNANDGQKAIAVNNAVIPEGDGDVFDLADGDTWYMRYVRDGNSMDITWYSDSARTSVQATKTLDVTNISDLRYFVVRNRSSAITTPDARITGYIDNVKFYNGVTTPTPATWTIRPTYESNFTVDNWLDQDSTYIGVDTSANQLDFAVKRDSTRASSVDMLGETISETKWILRWDMVTTTHTQSAGNANNCWFGISSLPSSTAGYSAKDWLGLWIDLRQTDSASNTYAETCTAQGNHVGTKSTAFTSKAWFADNYTFGLQLQRISADSFKVSIFDSHDYDNEIESQTVTTSSSVNNLRYLGIWNANDSAFPNTYSGYTPRIRFWNNANEGDLT